MPEDRKTNLLTILDEITELIYVADMENHEVLYINEAGKRQFGREIIPAGVKCYQLFQGLKEPCPFCALPSLYGEGYMWEQKSPITGRHYVLKDYLLDWEGRPARLEIAFDMTEARKEERALKNALEGEKLVLHCVRILYEEKNLDKAIHTVLETLGKFFGADRVYIMQKKDETFKRIYEWCGEGVKTQREILQTLSFTQPESWKAYIERLECVVIRELEEVRQEEELFLLLKKQGVRSLVLTPFEKKHEITGYLAVVNSPAEKIANVQSMLEPLRYFIMLTFQKKADEELLEHMSCHDMLTGLYNRNKYIMDIKRFSSFEEPLGIVYLDVNGLKEINDKQGHSSGDRMLVSCAEKMSRVFQGADIYRTGGDEFVIVCAEKTRERFERLCHQLGAQFAADGPGSVAMGCQWTGENCDFCAQVIIADEKMYADKDRYYSRRRTSS